MDVQIGSQVILEIQKFIHKIASRELLGATFIKISNNEIVLNWSNRFETFMYNHSISIKDQLCKMTKVRLFEPLYLCLENSQCLAFLRKTRLGQIRNWSITTATIKEMSTIESKFTLNSDNHTIYSFLDVQETEYHDVVRDKNLSFLQVESNLFEFICARIKLNSASLYTILDIIDDANFVENKTGDENVKIKITRKAIVIGSSKISNFHADSIMLSSDLDECSYTYSIKNMCNAAALLSTKSPNEDIYLTILKNSLLIFNSLKSETSNDENLLGNFIIPIYNV